MSTGFANAVGPDGTLRPDSANAHAPAGHNELQTIQPSHPRVAEESEAAVAGPATPLPRLEKFASDLRKLIPLILEVKAGAKPGTISKRQGMSSFAQAINPDGTLKPALASSNARSIHKKLNAIRQSHPQVAKAFEAAVNRPASLTSLEQAASDIKDLIPLILEVKAGQATPWAISNRSGMGGFRHAINPDGTLKPASAHRYAESIHDKLEKIEASHPEVAKALNEAVALPSAPPPRLEQFASDLRDLIPLILEVKAGRAKPGAISKTFANAFNPDATLKPASAHLNAQTVHNKLQAVRQSHPKVVEAFEAAVNQPRRKAPPATPVEAGAPGVAPLAVTDFGARRHELARLIMQIRQQAVSLEDAESSFPGLSRWIDPSGLWRSEHEMALAFDELVAPHQQADFLRLLQEVNALLVPGALPPGESSASAAPAEPADPQEPVSAGPSQPMFDLNEPWPEPDPPDDAPLPPPEPAAVPASAPIKPEPIDRAPAIHVPVLVETPLDQARTAFYKELAQVCDLTGDTPLWSSRLAETGGVIVHHRMQPVPGNDDKFPLRDPDNPERAHPRYARADGRCDPNVKLTKIKLAGKEMHHVLQRMCQSDPRLQLGPEQLKPVMDKLIANAQQEFERLIREQERQRDQPPRCLPKELSAVDVQDHEQALIGQYGLFVPRPSNPAEHPTLSNGRILGFYMGALLENERQRQQAQATHPDSDHYAIDAGRLPRRQRGRPNWGGAGKRTPVTYAGLGSANSMAFANTALRRPDPDHPEPAYDYDRLNALFLPFDLELTDKDGVRRNEVAMALVALDNLFLPGDDRPHAQVLADYGPGYLINFSPAADASDDDSAEVKPGVGSPR